MTIKIAPISLILILSILSPVLAGQTPRLSTDPKENISMEQAWKRFVSTCALAVSDPLGYLNTLPEKGSLGEKTHADHGGNLTTVNFLNGRIWESAVIAEFGSFLNTECSFHYKTPQKLTHKEMAQQFMSIIASHPQWEVVGGYGEIEYADFMGGSSTYKTDSYRYTILNVLKQKDISVEVIFEGGLVYWGVSTIRPN